MQPVAVATLRQLSLEADAGGQAWDPAVRKALRRRARRAHRRHAGEAERGTVFTVRRWRPRGPGTHMRLRAGGLLAERLRSPAPA
jgi:hypothetical protein